MLNKNYKYIQSNEYVDETILANEYTFTVDGKRFGQSLHNAGGIKPAGMMQGLSCQTLLKGYYMKTQAWDRFKAQNAARETLPEHKVIAERYTGADCLLYTMDGIKEAQVCGRLNKYATIMARQGGMKIEVTWPLVARKMEGDKTFYACQG